MKMYEKSLMVNIIESKLIEEFEEYSPQGQWNNYLIKYLYKYIRENTYSGEHDILLQQLTNLKLKDPLFKNIIIKEDVNRETYYLTNNDAVFSTAMLTTINNILKNYYNYKYNIISPNRLSFNVSFGWLPTTTASWLNLINDECLIDYYIDGITLVKNKHSKVGSSIPDSGFVCYRITEIKEYDTFMFIYNKELMGLTDEEPKPKITVASLLQEIEGSKGATLNRIVELDLDNFIYEIGPYERNYLSTENSSIIIQVPYKYAVTDYYYLYDISNLVQFADNHNDVNHQDNYFITLDDPNFENVFSKNKLGNVNSIIEKVTKNNDFDTILIQYLFGDFIWRTTDSKIIAYAQNLLNALFGTSELINNGIWSEQMSNLIVKYKLGTEDSIFDDDVINKDIEAKMIAEYKNRFNLDPNEALFNEW